MEIKYIAGVIAAIVGFIAPLPYIWAIFYGKTRPHIFTWFVWTIIVAAAFWGQVIGGAGLGAVALGVTAFMNLIIFIGALIKSRDYINKSDIVVLALTLFALLPWWLANNPVISILLLVAIDTAAFIPTYRKTLKHPELESASLYWMSVVKHLFSIVALMQYNILTLTFPLMLVFTNLGLLLVILLKQDKLKRYVAYRS